MKSVRVACVALILACAWPAAVAAAPPPPPAGAAAFHPGTIVSSGKLPKRLWLPGTTGKAFALKYVTSSPFGGRAFSTGALFLPKGKPPAGGWPIVAWAHGTSGIGNACAPSRVGPALRDRDRPYLAKWLAQGYAI